VVQDQSKSGYTTANPPPIWARGLLGAIVGAWLSIASLVFLGIPVLLATWIIWGPQNLLGTALLLLLVFSGMIPTMMVWYIVRPPVPEAISESGSGLMESDARPAEPGASDDRPAGPDVVVPGSTKAPASTGAHGRDRADRAI
jgi:hypothetical protein